MKQKINITVDTKVWKLFSKNCKLVGLNASRVISVFMAGMIDERPLDRMERFVDITRELREKLRFGKEPQPFTKEATREEKEGGGKKS